MTSDDDSHPDPVPAFEGHGYGAMIDSLRRFLDQVAGAAPDVETVAALHADLDAWSQRLAPFATDEASQVFARLRDLPGRAQTMTPQLFVDASDDVSASGHVTFGRYYLGGNGAAHGGALPLLFDEMMGRLANAGDRLPARTAFLHVDYRSITPIGKRLSVRAWFESEEGRKRMLRAELHDGDTLCAEAHGLFVELKPGQP